MRHHIHSHREIYAPLINPGALSGNNAGAVIQGANKHKRPDTAFRLTRGGYQCHSQWLRRCPGFNYERNPDCIRDVILQ